MKPRIGIIGARRARNGLGPFVARFLQQSEADVCAFLSTDAAHIEETARDLEQLGVRGAQGETDPAALVENHNLDALVILCPSEKHAGYLGLALDHGLHTLCEKPLTLNGREAARPAIDLIQKFRAAGLWLEENCQWPYLLDPLRQVCEWDHKAPLKTFAMGLSPSAEGLAMGSDSLSHPLSFLQAWVGPEGRVDRIRVEGDELPGPRTVRFRYQAGNQGVEASVFLEDSPARPRPAWIECNGYRTERLIRAEDYAIFLGTGDSQMPVKDPLEQHLDGFVRTLRLVLEGKEPPPTHHLEHRASMLHDLLAAFPPTDL